MHEELRGAVGSEGTFPPVSPQDGAGLSRERAEPAQQQEQGRGAETDKGLWDMRGTDPDSHGIYVP